MSISWRLGGGVREEGEGRERGEGKDNPKACISLRNRNNYFRPKALYFLIEINGKQNKTNKTIRPNQATTKIVWGAIVLNLFSFGFQLFH